MKKRQRKKNRKREWRDFNARRYRQWVRSLTEFYAENGIFERIMTGRWRNSANQQGSSENEKVHCEISVGLRTGRS